jgi:hypothetical protein
MTAIHVNDIETGIPGPLCSVYVETLDVVYVILIHFMAIRQGLELRGILAGTAWRLTRFHAWSMRSAIPQLDTGQRAVLVNVLRHGAQIAHITLIPETR